MSHICVVVTDSRLSYLSARMALRLRSAYKTKTWTQYHRKFKIFIMFCCFTGVNEQSYTLNTVLCFIEFLVHNGLQHDSIVNYISAIRNMFKWFQQHLEHRMELHHEEYIVIHTVRTTMHSRRMYT